MTPDQVRAEAIRRRVAARKSAAQTPDGRQTAPGTTNEQAADIPPGMIYDPETGGYADAAAMAARKGPVMGAIGNFVAGGAFVGEGIDEAIGATMGPINQEVARQSISQFQEAHPVMAGAARLAGGIASAAPLAGPGAGIIGAASGPVMKAAAAAGVGAVAGAAEGAASGYLRGTGDNRADSAGTGAAIGGAVGGVMGPVALGAGALGKELFRRVKKLDVQTISDELGVDRRAAAIIKQAIINDDLNAARQALRRSGGDAMLADAGPGTKSLLDASAQTGGAPLRIARDAVEKRAAAAKPKITAALDTILGAPDGRKAATAAINKRTEAARKAAYDAAYARPTPMVGAEGEAVKDALDRIEPSLMQSAVKKANAWMREQGRTNQNIMASIAPDGSVKFSQPLNYQQMDAIKRSLGEIADDGTDKITGQVSSDGALAGRLAKRLRDAMVQSNPEYARALKLGGDTIKERDALNMGAKLLNESVTLEDVRNAMKGASEAEKAAIRQGIRQDIDRRMGAVRATLGDLSATDARQAARSLLDVSSDNAKRKLAMALGSDYKKLRFVMDEASAALELRAAMAANSQTAIRTATREGIDQTMAPSAAGELMQANIPAATSKAVSFLTGANKLPYTEREKVLSQVARALTATRGPGARKALDAIGKAMAGQPINEAQATEIAKMVGGNAFILGQQGLSEGLSPTAPSRP